MPDQPGSRAEGYPLVAELRIRTVVGVMRGHWRIKFCD